MKIVWTDDALSDYHQNIDYLIAEWSDQTANEFINDVDKILELIQEYPAMFPDSGYNQIRKAVIRKQITLLYKVDEISVQLIRFWNNYQNPTKLKI